MNAPRFKHDCAKCEFLGGYRYKGEDYDLYYCPQHGFPTVLARWSDDGPDYLSGLDFGSSMAQSLASSEREHPMAEAYRRYIALENKE